MIRKGSGSWIGERQYNVTRRGGRVAISDIVSDEDVPEDLRRDPDLWSGCVSGSYREDAFLEAFDRAGFYGMEIVKRDERPWRKVIDDDGHLLERGRRMVVCDKTFQLYQREPYARDIIPAEYYPSPIPASKRLM